MAQYFIEVPVKDTPKTARLIANQLIPQWEYQTASIVPFLMKDSTKNLFKNLWQYCRNNYAYHEDPAGKELIRSPFQSKRDAKSGIDCEDFSIIICGVLLQLGHAPTLRIVDFGNGWSHIYVVCDGVVIDAVNERFNWEEKYMKKMDFKVKKATNKEIWRVSRNNGLGRLNIDAIEARNDNSFVENGNRYVRQKPLTELILGKDTKVSFSFDIVVDATYAIISADDLQPSHLGKVENPLHFIPEAQPRNRATSESGATIPIAIAGNLRPAEICEGSTAYAGCPIVNARGEVIQGNGRAYTMKYYWDNYQSDPKGYAKYLLENRSNYGFESNVNIRQTEFLNQKKFQAYIGGGNDARIKSLSQLKTVSCPVLVRIVNATDAEAIKLGQYKQSDLEALSTKSNEIKSRVNRIDESRLSRVLDNVFAQSSADDSLSDIIRKTNLLTQLIKLGAIRPDEIEEFYRNGQINEKGVKIVADILLNLIFKGSDTNTPEIFSQLPMRTQNAIVKATPFLLKVSEEKSISKDVSKAIIATRDFLSSGINKVVLWERVSSMFGGTPKEQYSNFERKLVDIFCEAKTQSEIIVYFENYANAVKDTEADLVSPAHKGLSKKEAIAVVFEKAIIETPKKSIIEPKLKVGDSVKNGSVDYIENKKMPVFREEDKFTQNIFEKLKNGVKLNKASITKIALSYGVTNDSEIKELTEYAIVLVCREIVKSDYSYKDIYQDLVQFYQSQPNLSLRTSNSILLQQYSTPSPIAYLMGVYCRLFDKSTTVFEPSAGNGLLTIASTKLSNVFVNEIDKQRNENLQKQGFRSITSIDGSKDFDSVEKLKDEEFDAIITNPPFGALDVKSRVTFDGYEIKDLDHLMAIRALNKMKDSGKAAIIIGGHTNWDELGRVQAGKNRTFLNYLYKHYNVDDVILINGDLYSRQGTSFDIRLILIDGRKQKPEGVSPLKNAQDATIEKTFESLFDKVMDTIEFGKKNSIESDKVKKLKLAKAKLLLAKARLKFALL